MVYFNKHFQNCIESLDDKWLHNQLKPGILHCGSGGGGYVEVCLSNIKKVCTKVGAGIFPVTTSPLTYLQQITKSFIAFLKVLTEYHSNDLQLPCKEVALVTQVQLAVQASCYNISTYSEW